jgi:hypothetical protein
MPVTVVVSFAPLFALLSLQDKKIVLIAKMAAIVAALVFWVKNLIMLLYI